MGEDILVAHCPERVLPGRILTELVENDRIVGGINDASTDVACDFYSEFVRGEVLRTDASTAEMTKLVENTFRDVNIAFANELSVICDSLISQCLGRHCAGKPPSAGQHPSARTRRRRSLHRGGSMVHCGAFAGDGEADADGA